MKFDISKLSQGLMQMGSNLLQTGISYSIMKDNMRQGSIFGGGGCCGGGYDMGGYSGGGYGMGGGYYGGMDPMMMGGNIFSMGGMNPMMGGMNPMMGGMGYNMGMGDGMNDPYGSGYGGGFAGGYGAVQGLKDRMEIETQQLASGKVKTQNAKADNVAKSQDTTQGANFEKAQHEMSDEQGNPVSGKSFNFMSEAWSKLHNKENKTQEDKTKEAKEYKEGISNFGKSHLMQMDKTSGNGDGELTLQEFIKAQLKDLPEDATSEKKAEAKAMATVMFNKLDQNGDKIIDWKENTSMMFALDNGAKEVVEDGKIDATEFERASVLGTTEQPNELDVQLRKGYGLLFGNEG